MTPALWPLPVPPAVGTVTPTSHLLYQHLTAGAQLAGVFPAQGTGDLGVCIRERSNCALHCTFPNLLPGVLHNLPRLFLSTVSARLF